MSPKPRDAEEYAGDVALVDRCLAGDRTAWVELVDRYRKLIYSIPIRIGLSPDVADEVFQDVCLRLLTRLETLRDGRSLARWLIVTAQRRSFDLLAERRRYVSSDSSEDGTPSELEHPGLWGEQLLIEAESAERIRQALARLSEPCREIVRGLFYEDPPLSYVQLGKRMGRPHGSLGPMRQRCLQTLRDLFETLDP